MTLPEAVTSRLDTQDDPALWTAILESIAERASLLKHPPAAIAMGRCSHWLRPHQTRWTAAGGFAWPVGYEANLQPGHDWTVTWRFDGRPPRPKGEPSLRVSVPARSALRRKAAVHVVWPRRTLAARETTEAFYGFARSPQGWTLVAEREFGPMDHC